LKAGGYARLKQIIGILRENGAGAKEVELGYPKGIPVDQGTEPKVGA